MMIDLNDVIKAALDEAETDMQNRKRLRKYDELNDKLQDTLGINVFELVDYLYNGGVDDDIDETDGDKDSLELKVNDKIYLMIGAEKKLVTITNAFESDKLGEMVYVTDLGYMFSQSNIKDFVSFPENTDTDDSNDDISTEDADKSYDSIEDALHSLAMILGCIV